MDVVQTRRAIHTEVSFALMCFLSYPLYPVPFSHSNTAVIFANRNTNVLTVKKLKPQQYQNLF